MIPKKVENAINEQINAEIYSAYLYLSMAAYFESMDLSGFANWMSIQFQEELSHAMKLFHHIVERGGRVTLKPIEGPPTEWDSPLAVFEATLKHEQKVTALINELVFLAREERDNAAEIFLQWFVTEQVEEEDNAGKILGRLRMIKDSSQGLYMLDKELGQRVYTPPSQEGGE